MFFFNFLRVHKSEQKNLFPSLPDKSIDKKFCMTHHNYKSKIDYNSGRNNLKCLTILLKGYLERQS